MTDHISVQAPMDQLVLPPEDVRSGRSEEDVMGLASSMGDPDTGQQQPATLYPNDHAEVVEDGTAEELRSLFEDGHPMVIHDGVTRYRAAESLGWSTLWAVIVPEPPENELIARLDANTERVDMDDWEVFSTLKGHYETTDTTLEEIGEKVGLSASYVSDIFSTMEAPDFITDPWETSGHPVETGHARALKSFLTANTVEDYQEAGGLSPDAARQRAAEDARLMVNVQERHQLTVSEFRDRCKRKKKETLDDLRSSKDAAEKQAEGRADRATKREKTPTTPDLDPCVVCGADRDNDHRIAVPVCEQDYGLLSEARANADPLMDNSPSPAGPTDSPDDQATAKQRAVQALTEATGAPQEEVAGVVEELLTEAERARQEPATDGGPKS